MKKSAAILACLFVTSALSLEVEETKKLTDELLDAAYTGKSDQKIVQLKKTILEDLYATSHATIFNKKIAILKDGSWEQSTKLYRKSVSQQTPADFTREYRRYLEWKDLKSKLELAEEDFSRGYIQEIATGQNSKKGPPFEIKAVEQPVLKPGDAEKNAALQEANKAAQAFIDALKKGDQKTFVGFWVNREKLEYEKELLEAKYKKDYEMRSDIHRCFEKETKFFKDGGKIQLVQPFAYPIVDENVYGRIKKNDRIQLRAIRWSATEPKDEELIHLTYEDGKYAFSSCL